MTAMTEIQKTNRRMIQVETNIYGKIDAVDRYLQIYKWIDRDRRWTQREIQIDGYKILQIEELGIERRQRQSQMICGCYRTDMRDIQRYRRQICRYTKIDRYVHTFKAFA